MGGVESKAVFLRAFEQQEGLAQESAEVADICCVTGVAGGAGGGAGGGGGGMSGPPVVSGGGAAMDRAGSSGGNIMGLIAHVQFMATLSHMNIEMPPSTAAFSKGFAWSLGDFGVFFGPSADVNGTNATKTNMRRGYGRRLFAVEDVTRVAEKSVEEMFLEVSWLRCVTKYNNKH